MRDRVGAGKGLGLCPWAGGSSGPGLSRCFSRVCGCQSLPSMGSQHQSLGTPWEGNAEAGNADGIRVPIAPWCHPSTGARICSVGMVWEEGTSPWSVPQAWGGCLGLCGYSGSCSKRWQCGGCCPLPGWSCSLSLQWDEALLTMSKGEKAQLEIEPEWAYGKKGQPDAKYPSMSSDS